VCVLRCFVFSRIAVRTKSGRSIRNEMRLTSMSAAKNQKGHRPLAGARSSAMLSCRCPQCCRVGARNVVVLFPPSVLIPVLWFWLMRWCWTMWFMGVLMFGGGVGSLRILCGGVAARRSVAEARCCGLRCSVLWCGSGSGFGSSSYEMLSVWGS